MNVGLLHGIDRAVGAACSPRLSSRTCFSSLRLLVSGRSSTTQGTFDLLGNLQGLCATVEVCVWYATSLDSTTVVLHSSYLL